MTGQKGKKRSLNKPTSIGTSTPASADIPVKQTLAPAPAPQPIAANGARAPGDRYVKAAVGATPVPQPLSEKPQKFTSVVGKDSAAQRDTSKGSAVQTDINKRPAVPAAPATASAADNSQVNSHSNGNSTLVPAGRTPQTVDATTASALPKREVIINQPAAPAVRETTLVKPAVTAAADIVPAQKPVLAEAVTAVPAPTAATKTAPKSPSFVTRCITFVLQAYTLPAYYCAGAALGFLTAVRTELGFNKRNIK